MGSAAFSVIGVAIMCAMAVMAFFSGVYIIVERTADLRGRVEAYTGRPGEGTAAAQERRRESRRLGRILERFLSGRAVTERLALRLAQANIHMTVGEAVLVGLGAAAAGGAVGYLLRGYFVSALAGSAAGLAVPWLTLERKRQARIKAFQDQLLDVLALVVGALRAGHGLLNSLDLVSKELSAPASEEFSRVVREVGFGLSQNQALDNLVERMESDDLHLIVTAINISHKVGGDLSLVLEKIAQTIRERIQLQGEIRVLTTQQRLTSYLLVALPLILAGILAVLNPAWIMRLFRPGWVRILPVTALFLEIVGFLIARRFARIDA